MKRQGERLGDTRRRVWTSCRRIDYLGCFLQPYDVRNGTRRDAVTFDLILPRVLSCSPLVSRSSIQALALVAQSPLDNIDEDIAFCVYAADASSLLILSIQKYRAFAFSFD